MTMNRTTARDRARNASSGIDKHLANEKSIPLVGTQQAPEDVKKQLALFITLADAAVTAKEQWLLAVKAERAEKSKVLPLLAALKSYCILKFGPDATDTLADLGFTVRKKPVRTVDTKAAAAAKGRATRKALNTLGKRQKAKAKADLHAPSEASTAGAAPSASPGPVAAPAPAPGGAPAASAATAAAAPR
jgi:hypothetical protein